MKLWWALVAVAVASAVYGAVTWKKDPNAGKVALFIAAAVGVGAYFGRGTEFQAENLPIYSYGVMLGLSLVVGWYLTLGLADKVGLPKETMANCYVFTAIAAIAGSRILYILTNLEEFTPFTFSSIFALRRGGLVAYGGFIGGYLGSWIFLARHKIRLMGWADVAVPSLASGLLITRIGCYLFGCDFGKRLSPEAPAFLQKLGTFPHWAQGTLDGGDGSPAWVRHVDLYKGTPVGAELIKMNHSFPVHPTQIYESLVGLCLLAILLTQRKTQKFRGQIFFTFVFAYGVARFLLEIIRDDVERGEYGPVMAEHILVPGSLFLMSLGFVFGIALGITNPKVRMVARILAFIPPIVAYVMLVPQSFGKSLSVQLSTSQLIALTSGLAVSFFYARMWTDARRNPHMAMALGYYGDLDDEAAIKAKQDEDEEEDEAEEDADESVTADASDDDASEPRVPAASGKKKGLKAKAKKKPVAKKPADDEDEEEDDESPAGDPATGT
ncbi:MAG: Prolipoprotein diacylglyceryl transferase [Myxococcaceae bacterium]|nr:Prolipoprotein diacylglyceryl transferase [Myxococcaceae bacterium]